MGFCNGDSLTKSNDPKIESIEKRIDLLEEDIRPICFIQCAIGHSQGFKLLKDALVILAVYGQACFMQDIG